MQKLRQFEFLTLRDLGNNSSPREICVLKLVQIKAIQVYASIQNFGSAAFELTRSNYFPYFCFNDIISPEKTKGFKTSI